jgi:hypothetical protein
MVKNRHLLAGLVVLGAVNLFAFFGLISGERDSARSVKGLEREVDAAREEQRRVAESFGRQAEGLQHDLDQARAVIVELRDDVARLQSELARTRKELLDRPGRAAPRQQGGEEQAP